MNKQRILKLADLIEAAPHDLTRRTPGLSFDMSTYVNYHGCGTAACIAGWTVLKFGDDKWSGTSVSQYARRLLDLKEYVANKLFLPTHPQNESNDQDDPSYVHLNYDQITPSMAAAQLRNLAETGELDPYLWLPISKEGTPQ
jgi:hypothetical protein